MKKRESFSGWKRKIASYLCILAVVVLYVVGCTDNGHDSEIVLGEYNEVSAVEQSDISDAFDESPFSKGNDSDASTTFDYTFRNDDLMTSHYEKHGKDMGFSSPEEYESAANRVLEDEDVLHKQEKEDGDDVYYLEETNEFVVISTDGYIRTYFFPDDGIDYFNRQ